MSEQSWVDVGGHRLRCVTEGAGQRNFTCLHGLVDKLEIWNAMAPGLAQRGRVLRIDQRGHGESEAPTGPYSRDDLASDVVAVLDREDVGETILIGHSMGGVVAMATALRSPERVAAMVLIGATSQCREKVADWYERIAQAGERDGNAGLSRAIYGEGGARAVHGDAGGIAHVTRMLTSLHTDPLTPQLGRVECPTLVLVGENDPMGTKASELIHAALPAEHARLEVLPGLGHWLHVDAPDSVLARLDSFLAAR